MSITFNYLYFLYLTLYNIAFSVSFRWHFSSSHALLLINEARHIQRIERKKLCTYIFVIMPLTTDGINDHVLVINWPLYFLFEWASSTAWNKLYSKHRHTCFIMTSFVIQLFMLFSLVAFFRHVFSYIFSLFTLQCL